MYRRVLYSALVWSGLLLLSASDARTQATPAASHGTGLSAKDDSNAPDPVRRGWSATAGSTASYDSLAGWSMLETPSAGYRLNSIFSMDASLPFYGYMNAVRTGKDGDPRLVAHEGVLGDAGVASHFSFSPDIFDYLGTVALSAPTGNEHLGVGTGHVGYNVNNHIERSFGAFTPDVEVGVGDTSSLIRRNIPKSYTSSGLLAFFQFGSAMDLPADFNLDAEGYEQLPIGTQTLYSRITRKHGAILTQTSDAEDNGINVELDAPGTSRILLSTSFSRSIRLDDTTASLSLVIVLHAPPR